MMKYNYTAVPFALSREKGNEKWYEKHRDGNNRCLTLFRKGIKKESFNLKVFYTVNSAEKSSWTFIFCVRLFLWATQRKCLGILQIFDSAFRFFLPSSLSTPYWYFLNYCLYHFSYSFRVSLFNIKITTFNHIFAKCWSIVNTYYLYFILYHIRNNAKICGSQEKCVQSVLGTISQSVSNTWEYTISMFYLLFTHFDLKYYFDVLNN